MEKTTYTQYDLQNDIHNFDDKVIRVNDIFGRTDESVELFLKYAEKTDRLLNRWHNINKKYWGWNKDNIEKMAKTLENIKKAYKKETKIDFEDPEWIEKLIAKKEAEDPEWVPYNFPTWDEL